MLCEFEQYNIKIKKIFFCPHKPEDNCECRKPKILLLNQAAEEFNLELSKSYVLGDKETETGAVDIYLHGILPPAPFCKEVLFVFWRDANP